MISGDLRFEGFDVASWQNLLSLFMPGLRDRVSRAAERPAGTLTVVVDDDDVVLLALHSLDGRWDEGIGAEVGPLPRLAEASGARRVLALRAGAMEELVERAALRYRPGQDYLTQTLMVVRAARELADAGLVRLWPNPLAGVPIPSPQAVQRALDLVLPVDKAAVLVLWDGGLWTAVALRRRREGIDLVAGPDLLARWAGPLGGDWRRDHRVFVDAVARAVAPVHLGVFAEADTFRDLLRSDAPGRWAKAIAVRDVIVNPMPGFVTAAVGADAVRGVGRASAQVLGGLDLAGTLLPVAQMIRARVTQAESVREILGFDPLSALATALRREEPPQGDERPSEEP